MQQSKLSPQRGPAFQGPLPWICLGLLLLLTLLAYWTSLGFDFVWDDHPLILKNELLFEADGLHKIFFSNFWETGGRNESFRHFYRPVVTLSYWLNAHLGGLGPARFHAVNVLLHLGCVALAYWLCLELLGDPYPAFLAGVFFALHPCHAENVTWVSGRTDLLAALFGLLALAAWRRADRGHWAWLLPASASYLLALLSKEVALLFPLAWLALPLHPGAPFLQGSARRRQGVLAALAVALLYFALRLNVLGVLASNASFPGWARFGPALGWVLLSYLRLAYGAGLPNPHYSDVQFRFMEGARALEGWALLGLLGLGALWLLRRRGIWARALWLCLLFVLPVLSLGSFGDVLYADRFLYLPSLGLGLLLALGALALAARLPWGRAQRELAFFTAAGLLGLALLVRTARTAAVWSSDVRLFEEASLSSPDSGLVWNNLCLAYTYAGRFQEAEQAGRRAIALNPAHGFSQHNLGIAIREQGRPMDALTYLERAAALEPKDSLFCYNLAEALASLGFDAKAEAWYRRTLALKSGNQEARHNLGFLLLKHGRRREARPLLEQAVREAERPARALNSLGILEAEEGHRAQAQACFEKALVLEPGLAGARENLDKLLQKKKR